MFHVLFHLILHDWTLNPKPCIGPSLLAKVKAVGDMQAAKPLVPYVRRLVLSIRNACKWYRDSSTSGNSGSSKKSSPSESENSDKQVVAVTQVALCFIYESDWNCSRLCNLSYEYRAS